MITATDTQVVRALEAVRRSGRLPRATQTRADEISRHLVLANAHGGDRYAETIERARNFLVLCDELGLGR